MRFCRSENELTRDRNQASSSVELRGPKHEMPRSSSELAKRCGCRSLLRIEGTRWTGLPLGGRRENWRMLKDSMKIFVTSRGPFLLTLATLVTVLELHAGPFQNGSFESPVFSPGGHSLASGSGDVTGWVTGATGTVSIVN